MRSMGVVAVLLFGLGCQTEVMRGVDQATAVRSIVELERHAIVAQSHHVAGVWNINVPRSRRVEALRILDQLRFVPAGGPTGEVKVGLLSDSTDRERARLQHQAEQLARSIERIPGVYEARVHLSIPLSSRALSSTATKSGESESSASVLVLHSATAQLEFRGIRVLVSGATGIPPENIRVVGIRPTVTPTGMPTGMPSGMPSGMVVPTQREAGRNLFPGSTIFFDQLSAKSIRLIGVGSLALFPLILAFRLLRARLIRQRASSTG